MICARQAPDQIGWTIDFYSVLTLFPNEQNQFRNKHEEKKTSMKTNVACLYITHYRLLFLFKGKFYHSRALLLTKWMRDSNLGYIWCDYEFAHHYTKKKKKILSKTVEKKAVRHTCPVLRFACDAQQNYCNEKNFLPYNRFVPFFLAPTKLFAFAYKYY